MIIVWTEKALSHLNHIYKYCKISSGSEAIASKLYNRILDAPDVLKVFPYSGTRMDIFPDSFYTYYSIVAERNYRIVYYIENKRIFIVSIFDCRRNPDLIKKIILE